MFHDIDFRNIKSNILNIKRSIKYPRKMCMIIMFICQLVQKYSEINLISHSGDLCSYDSTKYNLIAQLEVIEEKNTVSCIYFVLFSNRPADTAS